MMGLGIIWMLLFWAGLLGLAIWLIGLLFPAVQEQAKDAKSGQAAEESSKTYHMS